MRRFTLAFVISTVLHVLCVFFISHARYGGGRKPDARAILISPYPEWIVLENNAPLQRAFDAPAAGQARESGGTRAASETAGGAGEDAAAEAAGGGENGTTGIPVPRPEIPLRSPFAVHETSAKAKTDSLTAGRISDWFAEQDFSGVKAFHDAVDERIQKRSGGSDVFSPWKGRTAESHKEEKNPVQLDFLPDETHVQVMAALYKKGKTTQKDLYLSLDPSIPMTAGLLNKQLDYLVEKGLVTRKKISPENLFGIATPFGVLGIEMSRKNKLNPVYEYKSQVDREKLLAYLQSNEFLLQERLKKTVAGDTAAVQRLIRRCEKEMGILAR